MLFHGGGTLSWRRKDALLWRGEEERHTVGKAGGKTARYGNRTTEEEEVDFSTQRVVEGTWDFDGIVVTLERGPQQEALTGETSKTSKQSEICWRGRPDATVAER